MANVILSEINHVDLPSAVFFGSTAAGGNSLDNVADPRTAKRYRTLDADSPTFTVDLGSDQPIDVVAIRFPRDTPYPTSGTVRHRFDADGGTAGAGAALDTGSIGIDTADGYGYHLFVLSSRVTARYWQIDGSFSGLSFIDVGRLWAGPAFRPNPNIAYGYEDGWRDTSLVATAERTGIEFIDQGDVLRTFRFGLDAMGSDDRNRARDLKRRAGLHSQVLFCLDPEQPVQETVIGRMRDLSPISQPDPARRQTEFIIEESS